MGFQLIGQYSVPGWSTSTPNSSFIYPLSRATLNQFDSYNDPKPKISLLNLGPISRSCASLNSHISCTSLNSYRSCPTLHAHKSRTFRRRCDGSPQRPCRSLESNRSKSSGLDPNLTNEIAHIQSALEAHPDYDKIYETNRRPVSVNNTSTKVSLSSRFSSYYSLP